MLKEPNKLKKKIPHKKQKSCLNKWSHLSILSIFRIIRGKVLGINAVQARFDILQNGLDKLTDIIQERAVPAIKTTKIESQDNITEISFDQKFSADKTDDGDWCIPHAIPLHSKEKIRVVFVVQHAAIWSSFRSVWAAANKDPRFMPKVVLAPFIHPFSSAAITYDDMRNCLIDENVPFCTADFFDANAFRPHVVFIQNPYEDTRPKNLKIETLKAAGARVAYIPYGLEMGGGAWNIAAQFDLPFQRSVWRIFARSQRHKTMFGKYCRAGNSHVVITGHPKFDAKDKSSKILTVELTHKIAGRKVVLWTPHFSIGTPPAWSTYQLYGEFIFAELQRRQDLFLLIRPHPLFFHTMRQRDVWKGEGEKAFRQKIKDSNNMALDESPGYHAAFSISDALMTDVGSFLLEYLPTSKPLLYLHHPSGLGMNDDGVLAHHLYTACSSSDIAEFIEMVWQGLDPRKRDRESVLPEFLYGLAGC